MTCPGWLCGSHDCIVVVCKRRSPLLPLLSSLVANSAVRLPARAEVHRQLLLTILVSWCSNLVQAPWPNTWSKRPGEHQLKNRFKHFRNIRSCNDCFLHVFFFGTPQAAQGPPACRLAAKHLQQAQPLQVTPRASYACSSHDYPG